MDREELETKVSDELGSTKLTLSEETLNGEYEDALEDFGDDDEHNAKLVTRLVNRLKRMDGQIHKDVSTEMKKNAQRNKQKPLQKKDTTNTDDDMPSWFKAYKDEQDKKWAERDEADKAAKSKAAKDAARRDVESRLKDGFKKAGVDANSYILRQVMRDIDIDGTPDIDALVKQAEKAYYKSLKEAGLDNKKTPLFGGRNAVGKDEAMNNYFERKKKREGWGNG